MANERRVRGNYSFGTVPGGLGAADAQINSAGLVSLPAIDTYSYAVLTLYAPASGAYEIVWVTNHAAGSNTATVIRGREGTAAQPWAANTPWLHGPTARDLVLAGSPRAIFFDDCDDQSLPDGAVLTNPAPQAGLILANGYNSQQRLRQFAASGVYQTPNFTFSGAPGMIEATWSRISAYSTGNWTLALRAAGGATNLGIYITQQSDGNDVIYIGSGGGSTGVASTTLDKTGLITARISFDAAGNGWAASLTMGARQTASLGTQHGPGGQITAGNNYFVVAYSDTNLTWRLHKLAVYG
jgi:hypothetical protein